MPLYICFCPDAQGAFDKRGEARADHLAMGQKDRADGKTVSHHEDRSPPTAVDHDHLSPGTKGSTMIYRYHTIEQAWDRLRADPYWLKGVWDKEKATIHELAPSSTDETMKLI
uniref:YCII-related domain-containing protein n=1 Tax=Kwoniella bestiolae CBS 10118 TaxID=1296100 RepID=A0A1B9FTH9_9TREE|nr:hypothetical protein I302_08851 [Kwoniella bestiolae CBS 10118]OCF22070.1 hypothetical protein I302_08851 [Kwoniella bestiolae CBS 10118]